VPALRAVIASLAAAALLAAVAVVALAAPGAVATAASPSAGAGRAQYCPPGEKARRRAVLDRYTRQMTAARKAYYRRVRSAKLRRAFVRKQEAQRTTLLRLVQRCN
jgi:hypothetical protein